MRRRRNGHGPRRRGVAPPVAGPAAHAVGRARGSGRSSSRSSPACSPGCLGSATVGAIAAGVAVVAGLAAAPFLARRVRSWGYCEREDDLLVRHGLLVARLSVVPYGRMQFIDVEAGPAERLFGLATLHLHTAAAASDARIPGLDTVEAARLRDRLADARRGAGGRAVSEPRGAAVDRLEPGVWHRLHPLSPFVRAGPRGDRARGRARAGARQRPRLLRLVRRRRHPRAPSSLLGFVSWLVTRWQVEDQELRIETGVIRRSSLRYPLAQVQAIDVIEPGLGAAVRPRRAAAADGRRHRRQRTPRLRPGPPGAATCGRACSRSRRAAPSRRRRRPTSASSSRSRPAGSSARSCSATTA